MQTLKLIEKLGTSEWTLRRLSALGTLKTEWRRSGRRPLATGESEWLTSHWELLSQLRGALRTEPSVKGAWIFGSVAKGTDQAGSDLDLVVDFKTENQMAVRALRQRLEAKVGRKIDLFLLNDLEAEPDALLHLLKEARPVVDRMDWWARLPQHKRALRARAARRWGGSL
jgi:predicted nucleotidyltransferase